MIRQYSKGQSIQLSTNFSLGEFDCHCVFPECQVTYLDDDLIKALQELREKLGPIEVLSGFRCKAHNKAVNGSENSFHMLGQAADIIAPKSNRYAIMRTAKRILALSQGGIGCYPTFVHLDVRGKPARWFG